MNIIILEHMKVELVHGHQNKVSLKNRNDLISSIEEYKKKYNDKDNVQDQALVRLEFISIKY